MIASQLEGEKFAGCIIGGPMSSSEIWTLILLAFPLFFSNRPA